MCELGNTEFSGLDCSPVDVSVILSDNIDEDYRVKKIRKLILTAKWFRKSDGNKQVIKYICPIFPFAKQTFYGSKKKGRKQRW